MKKYAMQIKHNKQEFDHFSSQQISTLINKS